MEIFLIPIFLEKFSTEFSTSVENSKEKQDK